MNESPISITLPSVNVGFEEKPAEDDFPVASPIEGLYPSEPVEDLDSPPIASPTGRMRPTDSDKRSIIGKGLVQGIKDSSVVTGAIAGFEAGMAFSPPILPVVGPFAKLAVGAVGGILGGFAGLGAEKTLPDVSRESIDPSLIPLFEGARTTGAAITMFPLAYGIPQITATGVGRFLSGIGVAARKSPVTFGVSETIGATGAGVGGGTAVSIAPGDAGFRFASEFVGGIAAPGRFLVSISSNAFELAKRFAGRFTKNSKENRGVEEVAKFLEKMGTDIPSFIRNLEKPPILDAKGIPIPVSAAQKTGDLGAIILENTLARGNVEFGSEVIAQGQNALDAHAVLVSKLRDIGDPEAFFLAAKEEKKVHEALISGRLELANKKSADAIAKIKVDTPEARQQIGQIIRRNVDDAISDGRAYQKALYVDAYKASVVTKMVKGKPVLEYLKVTPTNTAESFLDIATSMTPERLNSPDLKGVVSMMSRLGIDKQAISRYAQGKLTPEYLETGKVPQEYLTKVVQKKLSPIIKETDVNDLINIRSDLLEASRTAAARGDVADRRIFGNIAESVLEDLSSINNPAFDKARNFTYTFKELIDRTFAGEMRAVNRAGAEKLPIEILVSRAFAGGADATSLKLQNIEDAVRMFIKPYDDAVAQFGAGSKQAQDLQGFADTAAQNIISVRDAHARAMRLAASKAVNPDGKVNLLNLQRFAAENKSTLDRLGITSDLDDIVKAENAFKALNNEFSVINKNLLNQEAFAQATGSGNASMAVSDAIKSPNPIKNLEGLVKLAKRAENPGAVEGLKSTIYDYAFTKAGGGSPDGRINIKAFNQALFEPIQYGKPSIYNILRSQGAITTEEGKRLQQIIRPMMRIEQAVATNRATTDILTGANAMDDLFLRIGGARAGATAGALLPGVGGQLIFAQAGSKEARNLFDKLPSMAIRGFIEELTKDPKLMALMLKKARTPREKMTIAKQIHAYMAVAGLNYAEFDGTPIPVPEEDDLIPSPARKKQAQKALRQMPPTVQTRGTVVSPRAAMPAPGGASGPPAPVGQGTSSRKMLQSLFPQDTISAME